MPVGHIQLHQAERIAQPRLLDDSDPAVFTPGGGVSGALSPCRVSQHLRSQSFAFHDRLRYCPGRVEDHPFDHFRQLRGRGPARFAHNGPVRPHDLVIDRQPQLEFGHIGHQILAAQITGEPAPAVHIGADQLAALLVSCRGLRQFLPQPCIIGMFRRYAGQRASQISAGERIAHQCAGGIAVSVRIEHEPLFACIHRGAAIAQVLDQKGKALAGQFVQLFARPGIDGGTQTGQIVIRRIEPFRADVCDDCHQRGRITDRPGLGQRRDFLRDLF